MKKLSESDLLLWRQTNKDNPSEYEEMTRNLEAPTPATLPREILKKLANKRLPTDATLDLHGLNIEKARVAFLSFLDTCWKYKYSYVLIITGKGKGIIKNALIGWLKEDEIFPLIVGYSNAHRLQGGEGAFVLHLRKR